MKKLFLSIVAAMIAATATFAQSSMLATLSHDGEISTFYGATALRDAHNAAAHGDIITLSSGSFVSVDITKAITLRGAGSEINTKLQIEPTVITGDFTINIADDITERLTIEGIYHNHILYYKGNLKNATFIKDRFKKIYYSNNGTLKNATFIHCRVAEELFLFNNSTASCVNCMVWKPCSNDSYNSNYEFQNCVIKGGYLDAISSSSFKNCVLIGSNATYDNIRSSCVAYNCIGIGNNNIFKNMPNQSNAIKSYTDVFKTLTGSSYNDSELFELTDDAKTTLLGIDGTQVGVYGGNMPFDSTPTNPQITKCNVAAKSTADGKLSVDITVNGAE
ncbi:hypothetical protein L6475_12530 [Prevotella sp. E9-3]|uniref:hypothetical protein n=1 Tax=Prevotella sp. E9-3 TaxID=2913621 RepID=UPI001EDB59C1|nr:hypothetical protein [Prevotella sp. E9-3]UKK48018.1 hypothetical protein L6475_12530 [Prevotella sp. E9-3]